MLLKQLLHRQLYKTIFLMLTVIRLHGLTLRPSLPFSRAQQGLERLDFPKTYAAAQPAVSLYPFHQG
jgi:hypothetical protein